jgi:prephenate dehydrogenase
MTTVAVMGYGRFGAALSSLFVDAGVTVHALDTHVEVPEPLRATSVAELVADADVVVVAVPVPVVIDALRALRPHLAPTMLVMDVCSVKVKPEQALESVLGREIPWVATHPLFGPTSLALAERPLRVVVCPNAVHPSAAMRARELYEHIGCQILEQDAHAHDRAMAETHALAFFVAKGMLDAAVGMNVPYAPPSFQAIARTVDVVRSDAGHLFTAIQRENPYAAGARKRLLEAMEAVDETLDALEEEPQNAPSERDIKILAIPDLGTHSPMLLEARQLIDEIDREVVGLLARRSELARRAGRAKAVLGKGVHDPAREAAMLEERRAWAQESGIDGDGAVDVFRAIVRFSRRLQGEDGGTP